MKKQEKQQVATLAKEIQQYLKQGASLNEIHAGFSEQGFPESIWALAIRKMEKNKKPSLLLIIGLSIATIGITAGILWFTRKPDTTDKPEAPISQDILKKISEPTKITLPTDIPKETTPPKPSPKPLPQGSTR